MELILESYLENLFNLRGKTAVVIGAGGHICSELALGYANAGCNVAILDLKLDKAQIVEKLLNENNFLNTLSLDLDVGKKKDHEAALQNILNKFKTIDILINGAGKNGSTPFFNLDLDEWYEIIDSQITGTFLGCQVFGKNMLLNGGGSIINISSASASPPLSKAFTYSVAKAGIVNLTQNLAREWGDKGLRVNAIRPGFFPTEWNRKNFITPEREKAILTHTPIGRFGNPSELVGAALWLGSDASKFVTGSEVTVDGGFSCMTV
jgi:NAD(P)-dependent dehydrogenase (short-subunit alcohol dehydrogenase family)